jgi:hypothetical protein
MILKSISRTSSVKTLIKYIFKEQKDFWEHKATVSKSAKSRWFVPGVKLTAKDIKYLEQEKDDVKLLQQLKLFKGTVQEFIQEKLLTKAQKEPPFIIKHNLRARTLEGFNREFAENESRRLYNRSDAVSSYHVILSWSPRDALKLTDAILKDIANEYIRLRANNCLVIGTKHTEGIGHIHLHLAVSGNQINGKSSRQSKMDFQKVKEQLQQFQRTKYPFLVSNSLVRHGKGKGIEKGVEKNIKSERLYEKQALLKCLDEVYAASNSKEHFLSQLQALGHVPYYRNGKFQGVKFNDDRKYRIYRLGYDENKLTTLDLQRVETEKQLQEMRELRRRGKSVEKNRVIDLDATNRVLLYQETTDPKLQDKKRELQQTLVNAGKEFENRNVNTTDMEALNKNKPELDKGRFGQKETNTTRDNKETALQELQNIRNNISRDIDRDTDNDDDRNGQSDRNENYADDETNNESDAKNSSDTDDTDDSNDTE